MKIGILTFHFGNNYGGILQCYALQQYLTSLGNEVEVINYTPSIKASLIGRICRKLKTINNFGSLLGVAKSLLLSHKESKNTVTQEANSNLILEKFDTFRNQCINLSKVVNEQSIGQLAVTYDAIIVGSDQVWTSLYDKYPIYFLDFTPHFNGLKIAYAACSAHTFTTKSRSKTLAKLLHEFSLITIRDITTQQLVNQICRENPYLVADPTLLYPFNEFIENKQCKPYILTYILGNEIAGGHKQALDAIRTKYGHMPIKSILIPGHGCSVSEYADETYCCLSPREWVNLFYNASFVYTDSFHGIMFSTKFDKNFVAYYTDPIRSSRLLDLKERFEMNNIVDNTSKISIIEIAYSKNKMQQVIEDSKNILAHIIKQ